MAYVANEGRWRHRFVICLPLRPTHPMCPINHGNDRNPCSHGKSVVVEPQNQSQEDDTTKLIMCTNNNKIHGADSYMVDTGP